MASSFHKPYINGRNCKLNKACSYIMDPASPKKEASEELTRDSLIEISRSDPEELTRDSLIEISRNDPEKVVFHEDLAPKSSSAFIVRDSVEKYRSKLISISYIESPDAQSPDPVQKW
ncbi:hypothetical protein AXF42_Ash009755 [Apostasia shenzhenica]|uniref:Uncharacterized protein n=1 Tax=Apostasia shenzhenica TaxID=1088818 RepID=A0A2I0AX10_9ASPA|nr:hypothetical protein AXF42_Ash009755 [Apostasia shenzhenica]